GNPYHELAAFARAFAMGGHAAPMHLHQLMDEREADPQASLRARARVLCLHEEIKDAGQQFGIDTNADVTHADDDLAMVALSTQPNLASPVHIFGAVSEQIGNDLCQTNKISVQPYRLWRQRDRQL